MIPADLSARLRMIAEASFFDSEPPVQGTARVRELQARLPDLLPGQRFTATLQRGLPDGTFQAIIAGRSYTLALSHAAKAGDTLELIVTHSSPRAVAAQLATAPAAGMATALPANNTSLSATGRLISFLLTGQPTPQPAALAGGKALLAAPAANNAALLAPALRQALSQSGLFYESHQSQWLAGKRDLASLLREPQGQQPVARGAAPPPGAGSPSLPSGSGSPALPTGTGAASFPTGTSAASLPPGSSAASSSAGTTGMVPPSAANAAGAPTGSSVAPGVPGLAPSPAGTAPSATVSPAGMAAARADFAATTPGAAAEARESAASQSTSAAAAQRLPLVPDRLMPLVHQQLEALATQNYVWQGQVWPGQHVEWEIEDPERDRHGEGDEAGPDWNTTLRLTLPRLGGVEARLHLTAAGIALRLLADDPAAVAALQAAHGRLDEALAAADVPLTGFVAERRDAAG